MAIGLTYEHLVLDSELSTCYSRLEKLELQDNSYYTYH